MYYSFVEQSKKHALLIIVERTHYFHDITCQTGFAAMTLEQYACNRSLLTNRIQTCIYYIYYISHIILYYISIYLYIYIYIYDIYNIYIYIYIYVIYVYIYIYIYVYISQPYIYIYVCVCVIYVIHTYTYKSAKLTRRGIKLHQN